MLNMPKRKNAACCQSHLKKRENRSKKKEPDQEAERAMERSSFSTHFDVFGEGVPYRGADDLADDFQLHVICKQM